jgi:hypothetical protein
MVLESQISPRSERVTTQMELMPDGSRRVKIRVEGYDEKLGWYSSGSVAIALEQLPLLEQALAEMRAAERNREPHVCEIIPFPLVAEAV